MKSYLDFFFILLLFKVHMNLIFKNKIQMNKEDNQEMKEGKNNETLLPEEAADVIKKKTNRS